MKAIPVLFIADQGAAHPYLYVGGLGTRDYQFKWEPDFAWSRHGIEHRGAHVRRYIDEDAFQAEQLSVVGVQHVWPIYFAVETAETHDMEFLLRIQELEASLGRATDRLRFLEAAAEQDGEALRVAQAEVERLTALVPARIVDTQIDGPRSGGFSPAEPDPTLPPKMPIYGGESDEANDAENEDEAAPGLETPPPPAAPEDLPRTKPAARRRPNRA